IHPAFLVLALGSAPARYQMEGEATGASGSMQNIAQGTVWNLLIALPPLPEQRQILAFLDRESAKIDALITKKERLVELFHEKRTALISHAVTKGLDPNVPMQYSGVEWLGKIPAHWEMKPLGRIVEIKGGMTPSKEEKLFWNGDVPWVSPKDMK